MQKACAPSKVRHPQGTISCSPSTAIRRCAAVFSIPAVFSPFPHVATHVMKPPGIRLLPLFLSRHGFLFDELPVAFFIDAQRKTHFDRRAAVGILWPVLHSF